MTLDMILYLEWSKMARQGRSTIEKIISTTPYWRDVGDLLAYWQAQMELIENDNDLLNFSPIAGLRQLPFSKKDIVWKYYNTNHKVVRSSIAHTARIGRAVITNSVVCPGVKD